MAEIKKVEKLIKMARNRKTFITMVNRNPLGGSAIGLAETTLIDWMRKMFLPPNR